MKTLKYVLILTLFSNISCTGSILRLTHISITPTMQTLGAIVKRIINFFSSCVRLVKYIYYLYVSAHNNVIGSMQTI